MVKVLIVEDSAVVRQYLTHILSSSPEIEVVATAKNGKEAVELVPQVNPDVITMDVQIPEMDGFEATRAIMQTHPVPIVMVSSTLTPSEIAHTFQALEAGAVTVVDKPVGIGHPNFETASKTLVQTVKLISEVKVLKRRRPFSERKEFTNLTRMLKTGASVVNFKIVAIGISTGGPPVLRKILSEMPQDFPAPVLIVQHIAAGFLPGLVNWLKPTSKLPVHIATHGEKPQPGHVYFAPDNYHIKVTAQKRIALSQSKKEYSLRPAASVLFKTVAHTFGPQAIGVLLTGMGKDGAAELKLMKDKGAVTIAQDKESSAIHGMPGEAIKLGAAMYVLSLDKITTTLVELTRTRQKQ